MYLLTAKFQGRPIVHLPFNTAETADPFLDWAEATQPLEIMALEELPDDEGHNIERSLSREERARAAALLVQYRRERRDRQALTAGSARRPAR